MRRWENINWGKNSPFSKLTTQHTFFTSKHRQTWKPSHLLSTSLTLFLFTIWHCSSQQFYLSPLYSSVSQSDKYLDLESDQEFESMKANKYSPSEIASMIRFYIVIIQILSADWRSFLNMNLHLCPLRNTHHNKQVVAPKSDTKNLLNTHNLTAWQTDKHSTHTDRLSCRQKLSNR